jgi:hypothetical protein
MNKTEEQILALKIANEFYEGSPFDYGKEEHLEEIVKAKARAKKCVNFIIDHIETTKEFESLAVVAQVAFYKDVKREIDYL